LVEHSDLHMAAINHGADNIEDVTELDSVDSYVAEKRARVF